MRTITLELLRHGPAHNQLLSPLTPYMALCENHSAVTLHLPFEHYQFLHRLDALGYLANETSRNYQLSDTARVLGELLGSIPGLTAESNKPDSTDERMTHLRLILSASELALLPFELALAPNGLPGSGQHLLLQPQMPVCLTREIRRTGDEPFVWPRIPRILLIAAAPDEVGEIPLQAHLLVLQKLITPWLKYFDETDEVSRLKRIEEHLVVLPAATIDVIEQICSTNSEQPFTHIHILAHGVGRSEGYDRRYYLALHNAQDPSQADYISGPRLAAALRAAMRPESNPLARPAVVSLATCDSGNVGSVIGAGASLAHALHEAGIPLVVASQFPLSFPGSVRLVECLYDGLLWGVDPRLLLYDLRRRLYAQFPKTHDWASLSSYLSLPSNFAQQLPNVQIDQALRSINAAMNHADEATRQSSALIKSKRSKEVQESSINFKHTLLDNAQDRIKLAKVKLERLKERWPDYKERINGLLASTEKRHAEILFRAGQYSQMINSAKESLELLRKSRNYYLDTFLANRSESWSLVQYLSLTLVMNASNQFPEHHFAEQQTGNVPKPFNYEQPDQKLFELWSMARQLSSYDLNSRIGKRAVWANSNLIELYLLSFLLPAQFDQQLPSLIERQQLAKEYTDTLIDLTGRKSFAVYSTRRQMLRYIEWFSEISSFPGNDLISLAIEIFDRLPEESEEAWK